MKKLVFPILGVLMLGFSSCIETCDKIVSYDMPAIVGISYEPFQPTIITSYGTFLAPELSDKLYTDLWEGDATWTYFSVNYDQPATSGENIAYDLYYFKVETGWVQSTSGGESMGGYDFPIENLAIYDVVGSRMFVLFQHTAPADQKFTYELTYDGNGTSEPELIVRVRKNDTEGSGTSGTYHYPFAFNMSYFFSEHKVDGWVKFRMKYKTGVDDDGSDRYSYYYSGNLIEVPVE